jgi:transcription initiation factor TFIIIB Brf1 subunit/transcription initiation factor TFIIB
MSLLKRIPVKQIETAAHLIWSETSIADKVALDAAKIINQAYMGKTVFFNGKSAKCIISGLFYILGYRYNCIKKQNELAAKLGTNEVTIRTSYRRWLETFPELFSDVISKFATDSNLRFFVLLKMKQISVSC